MVQQCVPETSLLRTVLDTAIAVGTLSAVLVALFGQAFRAKFFPPKLSVSLADTLGEATMLMIPPPSGSNESGRTTEARYYHLRVTNSRRWSPATDTRVVLLQVEEPGPDGTLQVRWTGDIPLSWRHNTIFPPYRVVGPDAYADLCSVVNGNWIQLHTLVQPFSLRTVRQEPTTMVVSVQALSTQANSKALRLRISWDGKFEKGAQEMQNHLTIKEE